MKIGIIGSGNVGKHLAVGLPAFGHEIMLGTRDPNKLEQFISNNPKVKIGNYRQAAQFAELVIFAVSFDGLPSTIELIDPQNLEQKIVIDTSNPLEFSSGEPALALGWNTSAGEVVQDNLPNSYVVKALSACGLNSMLNPKRIGEHPEMPIAGNSQSAKATVAILLEQFGWTVIDTGQMKRSRLIEPMTLIAILDNFKTGWQKDNQGWKFMNLAR